MGDEADLDVPGNCHGKFAGRGLGDFAGKQVVRNVVQKRKRPSSREK